MSFKTFMVPREIIFGEGALDYLDNLEGKKATLVTGGSSMKRFGFLDEAKAKLEANGMEVSIIDGVEPNPTVETVLEGGRKLREFNPDWIISIGGGSAIDAAKVMWVYYEYPDSKFEELVAFNFPKLRTKAKFIAIPSTSGTASEVTAFSVITDHAKHIKYPLVSPEMIPDVAIIDPKLPATMPPHITANTGMDVMTHAIEAYTSNAANSFSDPLAMEAIKLVREWLPLAYATGDNMEARYNMHNASNIAGIAFSNVSLGLVHSLAHKIGGEFGITHGLANAILLPYIIEYNMKATDKFAEIEKQLNVTDLVATIKEMNKSLDIPLTIKDCEKFPITEEEFNNVLDRMAKNAFEDPCTLTNPRVSSIEDVKELYKCAYYGKTASNI